MGDFSVQFEQVQAMADLHWQAYTQLLQSAESMPEDVDGGDGAELMLTMMAELAKGGQALVDVHAGAEAQLRVSVDRYQGVDDAAADVFRGLAEKV